MTMLYERLQAKTSPAPTPPPSPVPAASMAPVCAEAGCLSDNVRQCSYVDRRQRACPRWWCGEHAQAVFGSPYCRRHAGVILALGADFANLALPDLDNRAPALANWVGRDLDEPIVAMVESYFPGRRLNASPVVPAGQSRDRSWGRTWKLISENGIDLAIGISVAESEDDVVCVTVDGRTVLQLTPPWIEARRHRITVDEETDQAARTRFYALIMEDLEEGLLDARRRDPLRLGRWR